MLHLNFGSYVPDTMPMSSTYPFDAFQAASNTQMTLSQVNQRLSRTTTRPRAESSSRVSKPNSASNSPGSSRSARRKTMASDFQSSRRHQHAMNYIAASLGLEDGHQPQAQQDQLQSRPISWHPSTQMHSSHYAQHSFAAPPTYFQQSDFYTPASHYSPEMSSTFSSNASPTTSFSSLPVSYGYAENTAQVPADGWHYEERASGFPTLSDSLYAGEACGTFNGLMGSPDGLDWNGLVMQGYSTTSPPTPDTFLSTSMTSQMPHQAISEVYYQAADEPEDEGEILVGMGLYDDKREEDPQLNNYRYTVSSLLGTSFRPQEPRGKGLKLEETWEPPKSDDEEEDDEDESED